MNGRVSWHSPVAAAAVLLCVASAVAAPTPARKPLLMAGKKSLYQRVLTRPDATVVGEPGGAGGKPLPAFSQLYVYERRPVGGTEWLAVGASSRGTVDGWVRGDLTLPWKSQMALAFTNPAGHPRTLLLDKRDTVMGLLNAPDPGAAAQTLRTAAESPAGDPHVLSLEPSTYIDISKQFYLLPILEAQEVETNKGFRARVLEIASLTKRPGGAATKSAEPEAGPLRTFSAAVVFVIDSTKSMGPYIERTREAVRRIHDAIEQAHIGAQVKFGLIAFRSNVSAVPGLEYTAKMFVDPNQVQDPGDFLERVKGLQAATVSSARFDEDPYAGLMMAVKDVKWDNFGGRYVVLITDAGAISGDDKLSTTGLNAEQVRLELARLGIALVALHLKTPEGKQDHRSAERVYRDVAFNATANRPLYYPIQSGAVDQFGANVDAIAALIVSQVQGASRGELVPGSARAAQPEAANAVTTGGPHADPALAEDLRLIGRAMQLAYLGRVQGTAAPPVFQAWLSDRDYADLAKPTTEVRVLLTKNQLSDLAQVVEAILKAGDESQRTSTADFFDLIRSAAANLARDPAALNDPNATKLGQLGILGEYLDDLPYKSNVMGLSRDVWTSWGVTEQEELLDKLRRDLRLYELYNEDADRWVTLAPGADPGDAVYPVPLPALP
jgi:hypothetical protein